MIQTAGIQGIEIHCHPFFRVTLVKEQGDDRCLDGASQRA